MKVLSGLREGVGGVGDGVDEGGVGVHALVGGFFAALEAGEGALEGLEALAVAAPVELVVVLKSLKRERDHRALEWVILASTFKTWIADEVGGDEGLGLVLGLVGVSEIPRERVVGRVEVARGAGEAPRCWRGDCCA